MLGLMLPMLFHIIGKVTSQSGRRSPWHALVALFWGRKVLL
jgi:hypothetical protein